MKKLAAIAVAAVALTLAAAAGADGTTPVQGPLTAAGYSVGVASQLDANCTIWAISGHGVQTYINDCDGGAAQAVASLADPNLIYERDWQLNHSDQLAAASQIAGLCYSISRSAPETDQFTVVGAATNVAVPGAALPQLAASLPSVCGQGGPPPVVQIVPGTDGKTITLPGDPVIVQAIARIAVQLALNGSPQDQAYAVATQALQQEATAIGLTEEQTVAFDDAYPADLDFSPRLFAEDLGAFKTQLASAAAAPSAQRSLESAFVAPVYETELWMGNIIEQRGLEYSGSRVAVDLASCIGLRRYGVRTTQFIDHFWRFRCTADGADNHAYDVQSSVTRGAKAGYVYWHFLSVRREY